MTQRETSFSHYANRVFGTIFRPQFLVLAAVMFAALFYVHTRASVDEQINVRKRTLTASSPLELTLLSNGNVALNDGSVRILCIDKSGRLAYHIDAKADEQLTGIETDGRNNLYAFLTTSSRGQAIAQSDEIVQYNSAGKRVRTLYAIDYTSEKPGNEATVRTSPIHISRGHLYFTRYFTYRTDMYDINLATGRVTRAGSLASTTPFLYNDLELYSGGVYYYAKVTGEVGRGVLGGKQTQLYAGSYDIKTGNGFRPFYVRLINGSVYTYDYWQARIFKLVGGDVVEPSWRGSVAVNNNAYELSSSTQRVMGISDSTPWYVRAGHVYALPTSARISWSMAFGQETLRLTKIISVPLMNVLALFVALGVVWLILIQGRRLSLKILLFEVAITAVVIALVAWGLSLRYDTYIQQNKRSLQRQAVLAAQIFDGANVEKVNNSRDLSQYAYQVLTRKLIDNYPLYQSEADTAAIIVVVPKGATPAENCIIASNRGFGDVFGTYGHLPAKASTAQARNGAEFVSRERALYAYATIYDARNRATGFLCLSTTLENVKSQFWALWPPYAMAAYLAAVIALFGATTFIIGRKSRRIKGGLEAISAGDFSARMPEAETRDEFDELIHCVNDLSENIEALIEDKSRLTREVARSQGIVMKTLASIVEHKSGDTAAHVSRVSEVTRVLAARLGYRDADLEHLSIAAMLHDVGKLFVPSEILEKPGKLTAEEFEIVKRHAADGEHLLENAPGPTMAYARVIAFEHHERWDGGGYPRGLAGEQIVREAAIVAVADVFDALISRRPYKEPYPPRKVYEIITSESGKHFDPAIVAEFEKCFGELCAIVDENPD